MTLDNSSANNMFVNLLKGQVMLKDALPNTGEFFHLRCCAYLLKLIVQDGLKEIGDQIEKIKDSLEYVRGSNLMKKSFFNVLTKFS